MLLSYTNRKKEVHYFRAVPTAKGAIRYYVVKKDTFQDLITEVPKGFEIYECPSDGRVSLRKHVPCLIDKEEIELVKEGVETLSDLNDIIIQGEREFIIIWHSQFNSISGDADNLSAEEAVESFGERVYLWKQYDDSFIFQLVDKDKRIFKAARRVYMSFNGGDFIFLKKGKGKLKDLIQKFCPYMGRESYFDTIPEGFDE